MTSILIKHGTVISPDALLKDAPVLIEGKKIASVGGKERSPKGALTIDAKGAFVSPGFIDTHIHGAPEDIFRNEIPGGTTSIVIAESCAPLSEIYAKARAIEEFIIKSPFGVNVLGLRLEGPYINKAKAGAQDRRYIRRPGNKEALAIIKEGGPLLKIVTVAPELKGALPLIKLLRRNKIASSLGHTNATYEEASAGVRAGIDHATHIFNAMRSPDGREPSASTAALAADIVTAEVILDFIHVRKELFNLLINTRSCDKVILITDSVRAEKRPGVRKARGAYRFGSGALAGSALTMIEAVKNCVKGCGIPIRDAVKMATTNPARLLGASKRKGALGAGMDADIVIFDRDFNVRTTIIGGKIVYRGK